MRLGRQGSAFAALAAAIARGFFRDRASVFFSILFPLMFLVLFGGILSFDQSPRVSLLQVGEVALIDQLPPEGTRAFEETFDVTRVDDLGGAITQVREGDADVAVAMDGDVLVAHYTQADQVRAAVTAGALRAFVDGANVAASGAAPTYAFRAAPVEDESLDSIQFFTPGLLGWAVAMSASFGAAATLQGWRQTKLLRRLQLAPVPTGTVVAARVVVTIGVALIQMGIFLGLGSAAFGLRLSGAWWAAVPLLVTGTLAFMSLGLFAGAVAKTAEGAVNLANALVLPMAFLSGSFFPLDATPGWLQALSQTMPLRHLNDGMLDVMVRGQEAAAVLPAMGILVGFTLVIGLVAIRLFRWEGD